MEKQYYRRVIKKIKGRMNLCALFFIMEAPNSEKKINKIPSKMARLAWPKAKYGVILAIIFIICVNLIYYKDFFLSFFE